MKMCSDVQYRVGTPHKHIKGGDAALSQTTTNAMGRVGDRVTNQKIMPFRAPSCKLELARFSAKLWQLPTPPIVRLPDPLNSLNLVSSSMG